MKLMLISDIHGSSTALEQAFALADREGADRILALGDLLNHGPRNPLPEGYHPQKVAELLNQNAGRITCVRGNCDSEVDQMLVSVPVLGEYVVVLVDGRQMFLTHGHIHNPDNLPVLGEGDIFCFGHSHIPILELKDGKVMFNPGSITLPKGGHQPTVGWYDSGRLSITSLNGHVIQELELD
ncbi:phosphodiesterase [Sansalvadorimonas sp. 2012CJ34-2]|uniref:Phosphoesterase n=1 Tax=Parendozoicomonas callyspongiae TaxID=2942213 RepID=A0ABT0PJP6_9GAMM|nr:phosphodiesterase [Sansalvadorimonas sp. 2012CJ34-2]MCL6271574.1 phosphodiesterase [Sansalvadorimonas sp. 2012CJ34-2]